MVSILDGSSVASSLASVMTASASPTFELQFNMLQNTLLDRLDDKINELNEESSVNRVDAFVQLEQNKLNRSLPKVADFGKNTQYNKDVLTDMFYFLDKMDTANADLDEDAFNEALAEMEERTLMLKDISGLSIGIIANDWLDEYRENGTGLVNFGDYADADARADALTEFRDEMGAKLVVNALNLDTAYEMQDKILGKLTSIDLQIQADATAAQAEKIEEIKDLREEYGYFLQGLSLAFEVQAANAEALSNQLVNGTDVDPGSVLNLFA